MKKLSFPVKLKVKTPSSVQQELQDEDGEILKKKQAAKLIETHINLKLEDFSACQFSAKDISKNLNINEDIVEEIFVNNSGSDKALFCVNKKSSSHDGQFRILLPQFS